MKETIQHKNTPAIFSQPGGESLTAELSLPIRGKLAATAESKRGITREVALQGEKIVPLFTQGGEARP